MTQISYYFTISIIDINPFFGIIIYGTGVGDSPERMQET